MRINEIVSVFSIDVVHSTSIASQMTLEAGTQFVVPNEEANG